MSDRRFFSGDTLSQALNQAAQHFKLMPDEIDYKPVEKRHGFLKVRRKVVIEVSESAPRKEGVAPERVEAAPAVASEPAVAGSATTASVEPEAEPAFEGWSWTAVSSEGSTGEATAPSEALDAAEDEADAASQAEPFGGSPDDQEVAAPSEAPTEAPSAGDEPAGHFELAEAPQPATKRYPPAAGEEAEAAAEALRKILSLASLELESEILQGDEQLEIELWGPGQKILLRDRGRLLLAVQHLLPRAIRGLIGRSVSCRVDSDNFHEIREERLRDLAQRAADDVRHRGRSKTLEPMSPDERRIVHLTLSDYPGVETESQGSGLFKRVMVREARQDRPRGFDPYNR